MTAKNPRPDPARSPALDKRKAFILATVVYEYVATAEPVGSHTLTQKYNFGVSSATIRNEMAELEAGGYLVQPHTSAGRVPSDSGYRTYVDQLMRPEPLPSEEPPAASSTTSSSTRRGFSGSSPRASPSSSRRSATRRPSGTSSSSGSPSARPWRSS